MSGSKFYVAWVISRFIIITGMICIATSTILWIGGVRGITAYGQSSQFDTTDRVFIESILMGLFVIGCGYLLIYLRKKTFDTDKKNADNDNMGIIKEVFTTRFSNIFGLIGGLITIGGMIWLIFISISIVGVQNNSRFCDAYPNDSSCYHDYIGGSGVDDNWVYELYEAPVFPPILLGLFLLPPFFIGQLIVIVPNIYIQVDMGLSDHA